MSAPADKVARVPSRPVLPFTSPTLVRFASIAFCGVLPALVLISVFAAAVGDDSVAFDFRVFLSAAHARLHGESPYPSAAASDEVIGRSYVYPPLTALVSVPFTVLPEEAAGLIVMALLAAAALAVPWVLGVRDWRCYGVLLLWPPVISGIQTGNVTLAFALLAAVAWRFRDQLCAVVLRCHRRHACGEVLPLAARGLARGDERSVRSAVAAAGDRRRAPSRFLARDRLRRPRGLSGSPAPADRTRSAATRTPPTSSDSTSACPSAVARAVWLAVGLGVARRRRRSRPSRGRADRLRRRDRGVARAHADRVAPLLRPSRSWSSRLRSRHLGVIWFVPLADVHHAGQRSSDAVPTAWTLAVALVTVALAVRESRGGPARRPRPGARGERDDDCLGGRGDRRRHASSAATWAVASAHGPLARLGRDGGWSARPPLDRAAQLRELPRRAVRPREHGPGGLEHGARAVRSRSRRARRASRSFGSAAMSIRSLRSSRRCGSSGPRRSRSRFAQIARRRAWSPSRVLARPPPSRLGERGGAACARLSRVPVDGDERGGVDPSRDVRDPALPLLHLVPRHRPARPVHGLRSARDVDGRAHGAADRGARHLVRARPTAPATCGRRRSPLVGVAWMFVAVYVVVPHFSGEDSIFYGFYDGVGGSPAGVAEDALHRPGRDPLGADRGSRLRVSRLARASAPLPLRAVPGPRGRRAPAAARERALGLPLDDRPAVPQRRGGHPVPHCSDGVRDRAHRRATATGSQPRPSSCARRRSRSFVAPWPRAVGAVPLGGSRTAHCSEVARCSTMLSRSCPPTRASRVSNLAGAHLSASRYVYSVPLLEHARTGSSSIARDPWIVRAGLADPHPSPEGRQGLVARLERDPGWVKVFEREGVFVFRRAS